MFIQLALGTALLLISIVVSGLGFWVLELGFQQLRHLLLRPPHRPRLIVFLCLVAFGALLTVTANVWIWALAFRMLGIFGTLEEAVYFALVAFTTLGFGDILLPVEWRLLSGLAAANGLLNIGLITALMVEAGRHLRNLQSQAWLETHGGDG